MRRMLVRLASLGATSAGLLACATPVSTPASPRAAVFAAARPTAPLAATRRLLDTDGLTAMLLIEGVHGTSTLDRYRDYIPVRVLDLGLDTVDNGPKLKPFTFAKALDSTSPALMGAVAQGRVFRSARLVFLKGGASPDEMASFKLTDVTVTRYDLQGKDGGGVEEGFSLSSPRVEITVRPPAALGVNAGPSTAVFDSNEARRM